MEMQAENQPDEYQYAWEYATDWDMVNEDTESQTPGQTSKNEWDPPLPDDRNSKYGYSGSETEGRQSTSTRRTSNESIAPPSIPLQEDTCCIPVPADEVKIRVEIATILCNLEDGIEPEYYELVSTTLKPLAKKLQTVVMATAGDRHDGVGVGYEPQEGERSKAFVIHSDASILIENQRGRKRGIVIRTPTLTSDKSSWVASEVAELINSNLSLAFNVSTGLNIKIGIGREYQLQDLKRISKAIVLFEKHMNMYDMGAYYGIMIHNSLYDYSHMLPCHHSMPIRGLTNNQIMREIDKAWDIKELLRTINCDNVFHSRSYTQLRGYRCNLRSVLESNTIEFRWTIRSLAAADTDMAKCINTVTKFVTSAITTSDSQFSDLARGIRDPNIFLRFGMRPPPVYTGRKGCVVF